jgi:uncharacterized protein YdaU (DUF1376 family)
MAKDPALLWYPGDWTQGTILFSFTEKGAYMTLLMAQFESNSLSIEDIKHLLGSQFETIWGRISKKFTQDVDGNFYNVRIREEKQKRMKFTESRKNNLKPTDMSTHMGNHMKPHMENENRNINSDINLDKEGVVGETNQVAKIPPDFRFVQEYFNIKGHPEEAERFYNYYQSNGWKVGKNKMKDWKAATRTWLINKKAYQKNGTNTEITEPKFGRLPISELEHFVKYGNPIRSQGDTTCEQ